MKKLIAATSLTLCTAICAFAMPDPDSWIGAPKGICITNIICRSDGVEVDFATDIQPPYRVGVHYPPEYGFGYCRARPIAYTDTNDKHAFVQCSLYDVAVFVQVYKADDRRITPDFWRPMSTDEWSNWVRRVHRTPMRTILSPDAYDAAKNNDMAGIDPYHLRIIEDHTWSGFVYTNATELSGTIMMINRQTPGSKTYSTNLTEVAFKVTGRDPNVGTGFRIMVFDNTSNGTQACVQVSAAYSAITNMSQEVLIKRGWKSLSSNGSWKISTDWEGAPVMVPCTNAVPYRIYGEGL